jgi:plastocyanin
MLSPVSKLLVALCGMALVTGLLYAAVVDERAGTMLFLFAALGALMGAVATAGSAVPDEAPLVPADAPAPERRATTTGAPARGSAWPALAAVAVATLGASAAAGGPVVVVGVIAVLLAAVGWFSKTWAEDPSWSPPVRERATLRLLVPAGLPVAMFLLAATIAISVSRILLAISKNAAVAVALVVAVAILGACAWLATRPRVSSSAILALVALAVVSMAGAGISGVAAGEREFHEHEEHGQVVHLVAEETAFDKDKVTVHAEEELEIEFVNEDGDIFHNVAIYEGEGPEAKPVFNGEGFAGTDERTYHLETPEPGTYVFVCDFHPNMKGSFIVEAS